MGKILFLVFMAMIISSCGEHSSKSFFFEKSGEIKRGEKLTDPMEMMEAAIFDGNKSEVEKLLQEGFEIDKVLPRTQRTPLAESIFREKSPLIRFLLQKGASLDQAQIEGQTAEEWVNEQASAKKSVMRALTKTDAEDAMELLQAVTSGQLADIRNLLAEDVNPNVRFEDGETPLTFSIRRKFINSIRALLAQRSLDVNLRNKNGETALGLARQMNMKMVVDELVKRKAEE